MKKLSLMTNVEKAKLLHQLLPDSIPAFIETVKEVIDAVNAQQEELHKTWRNPIITPYFWTKIANDSLDTIKQYGVKLDTNAGLFSDQLFDGYGALFLNHCIGVHAGREDTKEDFKNAFKLLYETELWTRQQ